MPDNSSLLSGVRVIESSLLGPGFVATFFADMGADVIKVEPPAGDYIRQMTWPIVNGVSLLHLHTHRGKKSITLNLKSEDGLALYKELVATADVVVEAMRPGSLAKLGLGFEVLKKVNPKIVFATLSGYGATGPYKDMPSHGIAFDTWSGIVQPIKDDEGFTRIPPDMPNVGINVGPMLAAIAILSGVIKARESGEGCEMEFAQADAAAYMDWYRIESERAYLRPEDEVTGNPSDNYERRPAGLAGMWGGVRYQAYEATDGHVLFMASEQVFWKNFCEAIGRMDFFEKWPGSRVADHARNNLELQAELKQIFLTRSVKEWLAFSSEHNTPIAPFNTRASLADDPQFQERMGFLPIDAVGCEQLPLPVFVNHQPLPVPSMAPTAGQHTEEVLSKVLGKDAATIAKLREGGVFG
ncbi:MAG: CoA transferase [Deltaproteobacteria bacterium]|nr:CoA transferase [Deltaproteobacteria bacterium]MBW2360541.1 CoA transferase [Deltaproteobacteria bacterium]